MRLVSTLTCIALLVAVAAACIAQPAAAIRGTVTFRDGRTLSGDIKMAELGVVPGSGIGSLLPDGGYFSVKVGTSVQKVTCAELATAEATWTNTGAADRPTWVITALALTTRDGRSIKGAPAWPPIHATSVEIGDKQVFAFPLTDVAFSPDNFLAKIDLGGTVRPTSGTPPSAAGPIVPPAGGDVPSPTTSATPPATVITPPVEGGGTAPAATPAATPAVTPAGTPAATPAAAPAATPIATPTATPVATPAAAVAAPAGAVASRDLGGGKVEFIVKCPECGKPIRIVIDVAAQPAS
jgi:hypothetical protein